MQRVLVNYKSNDDYNRNSALSKVKILESRLLNLKSIINSGKADNSDFKKFRLSLTSLEAIDPFYKKTKFYKELMELK